MPRSFYDAFSSYGREESFAAGEAIYQAGKPDEFVYFILRGTAALSRSNVENARQILSFEFPESILGLSASGTYISDATSISSVIALKCCSRKLHDLVKETSYLSNIMIANLLQREDDAAFRLATNSQSTALQAVARFILEMLPFQRDLDVGTPKVVLDMCRLDTADYLGLTIETVSRSFPLSNDWV